MPVKEIQVTLEELYNDDGNGGLEIYLPGTEANPEEEKGCPIFIEYYKGMLRLCVWNGTQYPSVIALKLKPEYLKVVEATPEELPLLVNVEDKEAKQLLKERLSNMEQLQKRISKRS